MADTLAPAELDALDALHAGGPPTPLVTESASHLGNWRLRTQYNGEGFCSTVAWHLGERDAKCLAAEHNAYPRLSAALRAAWAERDELRHLCGELQAIVVEAEKGEG